MAAQHTQEKFFEQAQARLEAKPGKAQTARRPLPYSHYTGIASMREQICS